MQTKQRIISFLYFPLITLIFYILFNYYDIYLAHFFHENTSFLPINKQLTKLGDGLFVVFVMYLLLIVAVVKNNTNLAKKFIYIAFVCLSIGIINNITKMIFARARPIELFEHGVYGFKFFKYGYHFASFPSGHTMAITSMCYALGKLWPRYLNYLLIFAFVIGFTRVIVNAHYFSDVVVGFIFAIYLVELFFKYQFAIISIWTKIKSRPRPAEI